MTGLSHTGGELHRLGVVPPASARTMSHSGSYTQLHSPRSRALSPRGLPVTWDVTSSSTDDSPLPQGQASLREESLYPARSQWEARRTNPCRAQCVFKVVGGDGVKGRELDSVWASDCAGTAWNKVSTGPCAARSCRVPPALWFGQGCQRRSQSRLTPPRKPRQADPSPEKTQSPRRAWG